MATIRDRAPIFVPLLVLALLICHGALGSADKLVLEPVSSAAAHQLWGEAVEPGPADDRPAEYSPAHGYYIAAFITLSIGVLFRLLFRGTIPTRHTAIAFRQTQHDLVLAFSTPGQGPTSTLLQVFRL
jgi:hypothetical protein